MLLTHLIQLIGMGKQFGKDLHISSDTLKIFRESD